MMTRRCLFLILALVLLPLGAVAQEATPTPNPNPMVYTDPGMHFVAPSGYYPLGQRTLTLDQLTDTLQVVGAWIGGDRNRPVRILLQQEMFGGSLSAFSSDYQQQLRQAYGDATFKNKQSSELRNRMPTIFIQMTAGEGFNVLTVFTMMWIDGTRGVALSVLSPVGEVDEQTAKRLLSDASAVRYPRDNP